MTAKERKMKEVEKAVLNLVESPLFAYRTEHKNVPVIGSGSCSASIVFVGEAPGKNEARTGKPFCGASGKILDTLLESIGLPRELVYITNVVKDRPPENRDPTSAEIELYAPFLDAQIEIIKPKVIATLGRFSMDYIMKRYGLEKEIKPISEIHGRVFETKGPGGKTVIIPLYHPAASIYNQKLKDELKRDFLVLKKYI